MYTAINLSVVSLNVRGIREQTKKRSIFSYLKDQRANVYFLSFYKKHILNRRMKISGKMIGVAKSSFPMALIIAEVCAL